jgi:hypothetical protein
MPGHLMHNDVNPYKAPSESCSATIMKRPVRTLFFVINFGAAVLWCVLCIVVIVQFSVGENSSPFALFGAICSVGPAIAVALAELILFLRGGRTLQRFLGCCCGLVGAFMVFGFLSNVFEAIAEGDSVGGGFWLVFGSVSVAIAGYGFWCCYYRLLHLEL